MEAIIVNSVKIIASIVAGVAVGKLASRFIIQLNAATPGMCALNKKKYKAAPYVRGDDSINFSRNKVFKQ